MTNELAYDCHVDESTVILGAPKMVLTCFDENPQNNPLFIYILVHFTNVTVKIYCGLILGKKQSISRLVCTIIECAITNHVLPSPTQVELYVASYVMLTVQYTKSIVPRHEKTNAVVSEQV